MRTSDQINELATALATAQALIKPAPKDSTNPHFRSRYADLAAVMEACRPALTANGIAIIQSPTMTPERFVKITTRLLHKSGQWIEDDLILKPSKDDPQGVGSCTTYGRRYQICAMVGVTADDDDDGNAASEKTANKQPQPQQQSRKFNLTDPKYVEWLEKALKEKNIARDLWPTIMTAADGKDISELPNIIKHAIEGA